MRLIDADAFERSVMFGDAEDMQDVIYALRNYPTAYDPDKVVEQLEEAKDIAHDDSVAEMVSTRIWNKAMQTAIGIVKGGGVDGN